MSFLSASAALDHVTVIDLTRVRAGPTAVRQLADWGANVIKVEMPIAMDEGDALGGLREGSDFQNIQRNKRSMTLNLKSGEGVAILRRLVERADVLAENYRPAVKDRLGIGYEAMAAVNPRLVYASISGWGEDGPYRERPGLDQIAQGVGGLMSITGAPGQGPMRVGIPIADLCAGLFGAYGILLALIEREKSGRGQWVKTSLLQAQVFMLDFQAARWLMDKEVAGQVGNDHPVYMPTGVFRTRDGLLNLAATGQRIWMRLCTALGEPELAIHPDYRSGPLRTKNRAALFRDLEARFMKEDTKTWIERLQKAEVPCGPINTIDQVFADPQVRHLGMVQALHKDGKGPVAYLGQPVTLSRTPSAIVRHPPGQGEHTQEILQELGYSGSEIKDLRDRGVI